VAKRCLLRVHASRWEELGGPVHADPDHPLVTLSVGVGLDQPMMVVAQQGQVRQVRGTAVPPGNQMMGFARGGVGVARREGATPIAVGQGDPQPAGHQPVDPTHVQHLRRRSEDDWDQVGIAAQAAHVSSRELLPRPHQACRLATCPESVVVERDHDAGPIPAPGGGQTRLLVSSDHRGQGIGASLLRTRGFGQRVAGLDHRTALRLDVGVDDRHPPLGLSDRQTAAKPDRPPIAGEPQTSLPTSDLGLLAQPLRLHLTSDLRGDLPEHLASHLRQPGGVHPLRVVEKQPSRTSTLGVAQAVRQFLQHAADRAGLGHAHRPGEYFLLDLWF